MEPDRYDFTIPVGNEYEDCPVDSIRPAAQIAAIRAIVERSDFDFSCGPRGSFERTEPGEFYNCPFTFTWYDKAGKLHATKIGITGRILREVQA